MVLSQHLAFFFKTTSARDFIIFGIIWVSVVVKRSISFEFKFKALFAEGVFGDLTFLIGYGTHVFEVVLIFDC